MKEVFHIALHNGKWLFNGKAFSELSVKQQAIMNEFWKDIKETPNLQKVDVQMYCKA